MHANLKYITSVLLLSMSASADLSAADVANCAEKLAADHSGQVRPVFLDQREDQQVDAAATTALGEAVARLPRQHRYSLPDSMFNPTYGDGAAATAEIAVVVPFTGAENYAEMTLKLLNGAITANNPGVLDAVLAARHVDPDTIIWHCRSASKIIWA